MKTKARPRPRRKFTHEWLSAEQVAFLISMSTAWLAAQRIKKPLYGRNRGPAFHKFGGAILYDRADVESWIQDCRCGRVGDMKGNVE